MSIVDGNPVNSNYTNSRIASKQDENDLEGIQNLKNTDPASGSEVINVQKVINENITEIDDHDSRITQNQTDIESNEVRVTQNEVDIADHETRISSNETGLSTAQSDITNLQNNKINVIEKATPNGVATLDSGGLVPSSQLPSFVDDVEEYSDFASFPATGETGKIYVSTNDNHTYRWSGSIYVEISSGPSTSDDLPEGSNNQYYSEAKVSANASVQLNTAKASFPEAPVDGNQYARKDSGWEQVESSGGSGSTAKLIGGGSLSFDLSTGAISFSNDLFLEIGGLSYSDNTIPISESGFLLTSDGQVAFVTPNSIGPGTNLNISVGPLSSVLDGDIVIARRTSDFVLVGDTTRLVDGYSRSLYDDLSGLVNGYDLIGTNTLSADVTTDGNISALTFNNLTIGKQYKLGGQITTDCSNDNGVLIRFFNGVTQTGSVNHNPDGPNNTSLSNAINSTFIASDNVLTFLVSSADTTSRILGDGTKQLTYVTLEEKNSNVFTDYRLSTQASYALADTSSTQSIPNSVFTVIDYDNPYSDSLSMISGSGSAWKATALTQGLHTIIAKIVLGNSTGWENQELAEMKVERFNSAGVSQESRLVDRYEFPTSDANSQNHSVSLQGNPVKMEMAQGDYVQIFVRQINDGTTLLNGDSGSNYFSIMREPDFSTLGAVKDSNNFVEQTYDLTVSGSNSWVTGWARGAVRKHGSQWLIDINIGGNSNTTSGVDISIAGIVADSGLARQAVTGVGVISTSAVCTAQLRQATNNVEIRGSASNAWYISGTIFLNAKPSFV